MCGGDLRRRRCFIACTDGGDGTVVAAARVSSGSAPVGAG
jgi:hypothetical protein